VSVGRRIVTGALWGQAGQMVSLGLATLLQIILARGLGAERYGVFAAVNAIVYLAVALCAGGAAGTLNSHLTKLQHEYGQATAAYLFWRLWAWRIVTFGAITLAVTLFSGTAADLFLKDSDLAGLMVAAAFYMFTIGMFQIANTLFFGLLLTKWGVLGQILSVAANIVVTALMIVRDATLTEMVWALAGAQALICAVQLAKGWHLVRPAVGIAQVPNVARSHVGGLWRFSLTIWGVNLLTQALGKQTDIATMQGFGIDSKEIGFYNLAFTLGLTANVIFTKGIGSVAVAGLSSIAAKTPEKIGLGWRALCSIANILALPLLVFVGVMAYPIIRALYGEDFVEAAILLQIFAAFSIPGQILGGGSHGATFTALGIPGRTLKARSVTGIANLAVNFALIPVYGARGAMVGTGVCGLAAAFYEYALLRRHIPERLPWLSYLRAGVAVVPGLIPAWFIAPHLGVVGVLLAGGVFLAAYGAMLLVLRPLSVDPEVARSMPRVARHILRVETAPKP
jgi:O-antigen/teichoic acid export membrane protein